MFKKLDKKLLHHFPLLWNTKLIYMILAGIVFHILAYVAGYKFINLNLNEVYEMKDREDLVITIFVLLGAIILVIWFLFYIKNNAFKTFYPKGKNGIFKEWLIILGIIFFFVAALFSIEKGKQDSLKYMYSELDFDKRIETIYKAGFFIDNPIERQEDRSQFNEVDSVYYDSDYFTFKGKNYPWYSLIARQSNGYYYSKKDSIYTGEVRTMLYKNDSAAVKKLMTNYLQILKEHHLKTNLTVSKWFKAVYNQPNFEYYSNIEPFVHSEKDQNYTYSNNNYLAEKSNYFVEHNRLDDYYRDIIFKTEQNNLKYDVGMALFYFAFALSLIVLAFRTSKLLPWFISLVIFGLVFIMDTAILESNNDNYSLKYGIFIFAILLQFLIVLFFTFLVTQAKKSKAVFINLFLLSFGFFIPAVFAGLTKFIDEQYAFSLKLFAWRKIDYNDGDFLIDISTLNVLIIFLVMYLFCRYLRNQKALPEY